MLYWWFPERVAEVGLTRDQLVLAGVAVMLVLEAVRLRRKSLVFPMRPYERSRVGAHVWLVLGCALAVVFFEQRFAMLTILGTTLGDPVIGELRLRGHPRAAPVAGFAVWVAAAVACVVLVPLDTAAVLILVGAVVAVAAEGVEVPYVDDNFAMNMAPLVVMVAFAALFGPAGNP